MKLMHWNIHSWRADDGSSNVESVATLIRQARPDVVSLVEVDEAWSGQPKLDEVATAVGFYSVFVPSFEFGSDAGSAFGGFGNALLSRFPVSRIRQRQLVWPSPVYDGSEPSEPRSIVYGRVESPGAPFWVGTCHLPRSDSHARRRALAMVSAIAESFHGDDWAIMGDFNVGASAWVDDSAMRALPRAAPTHPSSNPFECIDYCLLPRYLNAQSEVLSASGSDHLPVLIEVEKVVPPPI